MPTLELTARDARRIELAAGAIDYVLVRRRGRRGVGLKVDEGGLCVSAPLSMPLARVEALVRESERWVLRKLEEWRGRRVPEVSWADGERLPYRGGWVTLRLAAAARTRVALAGEELQVAAHAADPAALRRAVVAWYKASARAHPEARVPQLAQLAGIPAPRVLISSARSRWGSCNTRREVRLAWRLVKAPPELADYVICHELAHLRHMNHSAAFWAEVERQCPGHRELRRRLCATDHLYRSF